MSDGISATPSARRPQGLAAWQWTLLVLVLGLYVFPYFPRVHNANELPRAYLVSAMWERHTFAIDEEVARHGATADLSRWAGHQFSNKAPGASLIALPAYGVARACLGRPPSLRLTVWLGRVVAGLVPTLLLVLLMRRHLRAYATPVVVDLVLLAYLAGSMALTFSLLYFGHQTAAAAMGAGWITLQRAVHTRSWRWALGAGALLGLGPLIEYQAAFLGLPMLIWLGWRLRSAAWDIRMAIIGAAGLAASVPLALLLWYHAACFGSPWRTGYAVTESWGHLHRQGFLGMSRLRSEALWGSLFAPDNGLWYFSPWLLAALPGIYLLWRNKMRDIAWFTAVSLVGYVAFVSSLAMWRGGWSVGPRYITVMLPFMLPAVAAAAARLQASRMGRLALLVAIAWSLVIYLGAAVTFPHFPERFAHPFVDIVVALLRDGAVAPNWGTMLGLPALGSLVPYVGTSVLVFYWVGAGYAAPRCVALAGLCTAGLIGLAITQAPHASAANQAAYAAHVRAAVVQAHGPDAAALTGSGGP